MTPNTVSAWELMTPTEHAIVYAIFALLGCIILFCYYKIATDPKENQRVKEQLQQKRNKRPLTEAQQQTRLLRNLFWLTFFTRRK